MEQFAFEILPPETEDAVCIFDISPIEADGEEGWVFPLSRDEVVFLVHTLNLVLLGKAFDARTVN